MCGIASQHACGVATNNQIVLRARSSTTIMRNVKIRQNRSKQNYLSEKTEHILEKKKKKREPYVSSISLNSSLSASRRTIYYTILLWALVVDCDAETIFWSQFFSLLSSTRRSNGEPLFRMIHGDAQPRGRGPKTAIINLIDSFSFRFFFSSANSVVKLWRDWDVGRMAKSLVHKCHFVWWKWRQRPKEITATDLLKLVWWPKIEI